MASSTLDHWCTPDPVVEALKRFNHGKPPGLDPCSNPNSIVGARIEWYGPPNGTDGLLVPWAVRGLVYVNPPYSDKYAWMRKCHDEHAHRRKEIISLLPADTDTEWFHRFSLAAQARCFWRGRLIFIGDKTYPARFPSLLTYWGSRVARFRQVFGNYGWVV
jgi:hypothetical protein